MIIKERCIAIDLLNLEGFFFSFLIIFLGHVMLKQTSVYLVWLNIVIPRFLCEVIA